VRLSLKQVVWAANFHIARNAGTHMTVDTSLNRSTYVLGFSSYEGEAGRIVGALPRYNIPKPPDDYFESWINPKFAYAFTNFRSFSSIKNNPPSFYLRGFGHSNNQKEAWTNVFDGIFFIRRMYSCIE
jgi:erythromycin esterase